jgi:phytoene dehydrogenase-like protein
MNQFDVAVVGAGPEGLVAAITLARGGLRVILLDKASAPGGRATTCEFHPGFRASPYADELPAMPHRLYRSLDLARHGAILAPARASACISNEGVSLTFADDARTRRSVPVASSAGLFAFRREIETLRQAIAARAAQMSPRRPWFFGKRLLRVPWPGDGWAYQSLDEALGRRIPDSLLRLHLAADAISGRAVSPLLAGTALHALAPGIGRSGQPPGGLGRLGTALQRIASAAGVVIRCDAEVTHIQVKSGRAIALTLGGREEIAATAFLSALDLKQTFLSLIAWNALPAGLVKRVGRFRMAGERARVLFALDAPPKAAFAGDRPDAALGPIHVAESLATLARAHEFWRAGVLPISPLVSLRVPSFSDPRLAPVGKAVMTATISAVPAQFFDSAWTEDKRARIAGIALAAAERAMPGVSALVLGCQTIVGPDIESALGATGGDCEGGELAPDQALEFRPFGGVEWQDGRTPIAALYLGGPSSAASPFLLGASGERAALALLADINAGRLR